MLLHVHEHERGQFETSNNDLNGRSSVASTAPRVFDIGDFFGGNTKCIGQHFVAMFNASVHPIQFETIIRTIEHMMCHHLKGGEVATRAPDGVDIRQSDARL